MSTGEHIAGPSCTASGVFLESTLLTAMAATVPARILKDVIFEARAEIEIAVQAYLERQVQVDRDEVLRSPNNLPQELKDLIRDRKAHGGTQDDRPIRWAVTAGLNLRVDGVDVAAGPLHALCAYGRFLHELDYPSHDPFTFEDDDRLQAFDLGDAFTLDTYDHFVHRIAFRSRRLAPEWVRRVEAGEAIEIPALSEVTAGLIRDLSAEGLGWEGAGQYLGLAMPQWRAHAVRPLTVPGRLGLEALKSLGDSASATVLAWMMGLSKPHGPRVALAILNRLEVFGLVDRHGGEWRPSEAGALLIQQSGGALDPVEIWIERHPGSRQFVATLGIPAPGDAMARAAHVARVSQRATASEFDSGVELAMALWSRGLLRTPAAIPPRGSDEIKELAAAMPTIYLRRFFEEKDIPALVFEVTSESGTLHQIPNAAVVESIAATTGAERKRIEGLLRQIDFANGDVNHFLRHLAVALANQYDGVVT